MGTGASKQIDPSDSVVSFDDSRTHSSIEKKQEVQDEDEKAMEEHEAYLVCFCLICSFNVVRLIGIAVLSLFNLQIRIVLVFFSI